jgi:flagellar biosynthetic protein FliR
VSDGEALVLARCAGFVFRAPGFSHPDVPPALRAGFAFVLSLAFAHGYVAGTSPARGGLIAALASELILGAAIGTAASMLYDGAFSGGRALDDYVGIRASVPNANVAAGAGFGRLWSLAFATGFFTFGGYRFALEAFGRTFETLPPGALVRTDALATFAEALPATLLRAALLVAGPAVAIALVVQTGLAAIARVVPRFSTFTLAFGVVYAAVVLATLAAMPATLPASGSPWMNLSGLRALR